MKIISELMAAAIILAGAASCTNGSGLQTQLYSQEESLALVEGKPECLKIKLDVEYVTGGVKEEVMEPINKVVLECAFGINYRELATVEEAAQAYVQESYRLYKEANEIYTESAEEPAEEGVSDEIYSFSTNWELIVNAAFLNPYKDYITYMVEGYSYQGGAHGMGFKLPVVLDVRTGAQVMESDLFVDGYVEELSRLLTGNLHDSFEKEEDYESLFTKDIRPNGNFYLTPKGVTYVYSAYEIGPYYLGDIEVSVSWEELEGLLK